MTLSELNSVEELAAGRALLECCASPRWAKKVADRRPFRDLSEVMRAAEETWWSLKEEDWLEAFAAHPRIGEQNGASKWSAEEQAGMDTAAQDTRRRLLVMNQKYEERFGWIFLICATGKSAEEMLAAVEQRMANKSEDELRIAAGEQAKIMCLRLQKLMGT